MASVRVYDLKTGGLPTRWADLRVEARGAERFSSKDDAVGHAKSNPSSDAFRAVMELDDGYALARGHDPDDFLGSVSSHGFRTNDPVGAIVTRSGSVGPDFGELSPRRLQVDAFMSSPAGRRIFRNPALSGVLLMAGPLVGLAVLTTGIFGSLVLVGNHVNNRPESTPPPEPQ